LLPLLQQNSLSRHPEASAQINPGLPKTAKYALLRKDDIPHLRLVRQLGSHSARLAEISAALM